MQRGVASLYPTAIELRQRIVDALRQRDGAAIGLGAAPSATSKR